MAFKPTEQQKDAIICSSGTLVSAAAGSGKTAVLVERVINKIFGENPIDADRLLVVTFTKAAAEEMRTRIEKRISEEYAKNPDNEALLEQKIKFRNAKICTIDSFCIDLVRENFDRLGITPDFSIADDAVLLTLSQGALEKVINDAFEKGDQEFNLLLNSVSSDFDEGDLTKHIKNIYDFSQNMPFPNVWLQNLLDMSKKPEFFESLVDGAFIYAEELLTTYALNLEMAVNKLKPYQKVFDKYKNAFEECKDALIIIAKYCGEKNWDKVCSLVNSFTMQRISTPVGFSDHPVVVSAREIRNSAKTAVANLSTLFSNDFEVLKKDFNDSYLLINTLISLTIDYMRVYDEYRREKNVMTFADTTHFALSLLCENINGKIVKTDFANEIIGRFDEVLVDEFQDTNDMQDLLFSLLSDDEKNIFIVGDIKQSIYRFRGANPKNFLLKKQSYTPYQRENEQPLKKIILSSNFRSRKGICDFVNLLFGAVMNGKLSTVEYNQEEVLNPEAEYPETAGNSVEIKVTNVSTSTEKHIGEANAIADFIERFMANEQVTDPQTKQLRTPKFSDFTILFRSIKGVGDTYAEILNNRGIPVSLQKSDFIQSTEIQTVFSFLKIIENPTLDIPLLSVVMSPIFNFTAEEMANIRIIRRHGSIISAITAAAQSGNKKCEAFLHTLKRIRNQFSTGSISETITYLYNETDMLNIMSVLSGGELRKRNLLMLQGIAAQYDANDFPKRIEKFIAHVTKVTEKGISGTAASKDTVTLMTIHSSKGLQFPVCILADTTAVFNTKDSSDKLLISADLGVSFKINDDDGGKQKSLITRNIISVAALKDQLDEEMRLLYVALTRAKEKLLICITEKDALAHPMYYTVSVMGADSIDSYRNSVTKINSYADMIWFALMADKKTQDFIIKEDVSITAFTNGEYDISYNEFVKKDDVVLRQQNVIDNINHNKEISSKITENINFVYPFEALKDIESKSSVAILAHKAEEKDFSFTSRPAFMSKCGLTPAERGTATHRFMQFADFGKAKKDAQAEVERLYEWEFITLAEKEAIDVASVKSFFQSDLFSRMEKSENVLREMRFLTEIPASEISEELTDELKNEMVVVQGSVDCVFVEQDEIVVVDFKTDRVNDQQTLLDTYAKQLEIYAAACEKIFKKSIKEKVIYSFHLSKEIKF